MIVNVTKRTMYATVEKKVYCECDVNFENRMTDMIVCIISLCKF